MLLGQLNMMHLTEFKFVQNCLNGIFEEVTVLVDNQQRSLGIELARRPNLQLETISTFIDDSTKLTTEQMKHLIVTLFRQRCQLIDRIALPQMLFA